MNLECRESQYKDERTLSRLIACHPSILEQRIRPFIDEVRESTAKLIPLRFILDGECFRVRPAFSIVPVSRQMSIYMLKDSCFLFFAEVLRRCQFL